MGRDNFPLLEISVDTALTGDNVLIPAESQRAIRIFRMFLVFGGDTAITFLDGIGGTPFDGPLDMLNHGSIVLDDADEPWFKVSLENDFVANMQPGVQLSGRIYYTQHSL